MMLVTLASRALAVGAQDSRWRHHPVRPSRRGERGLERRGPEERLGLRTGALNIGSVVAGAWAAA
jgi:hypothetical protein